MLFYTLDVGWTIYNLNTRIGTIVLEMAATFEKISRKKIPLKYVGHCPNDSSEIYIAIDKVEKELG